MSWDRRLIGRAGYYIRIRVSPDDPNHLLIANSTLWRSRDGGKIWDTAAAADAATAMTSGGTRLPVLPATTS